jgi:hypothetical protein
MSNSNLRKLGPSRRDVLSTAAAATGALVVGFWMPQPAASQEINPRGPNPVGATWATDPAVDEVNAWVVVAPDETVTIRIAQTELGQGVWTSNAMMVCEELQCDWSKVRPQYASANRDGREMAPEWTLNVMGKGATDPLGGGEPEFGGRDRTGSTGIPNSLYRRMRTNAAASVRDGRYYLQLAGAEARERLLLAAAKAWGVPVEEVSSASGEQLRHLPAVAHRRGPAGNQHHLLQDRALAQRHGSRPRHLGAIRHRRCRLLGHGQALPRPAAAQPRPDLGLTSFWEKRFPGDFKVQGAPTGIASGFPGALDAIHDRQRGSCYPLRRHPPHRRQLANVDAASAAHPLVDHRNVPSALDEDTQLRSSFVFDIFQPHAVPRTQALAGLLDSPQKARIVFQPIREPVLLRLETDQQPGRLAVARNDDLPGFSLAKITRQVVFDLGQRNFLHS